MHNNNIMKKSPADRIFLAIVYLFLGLFVLVVLYPLIYVVSCSFSSPQDLVAGRVFLWPVNPGLQGYKAVLGDEPGMERIWEYYCIYRTGNLNWYGSYLYRSLCIVAEGIPHERAVNHCFCHHHVFRRRYHSDIFAAEAASHAEYCMVNCIAGGI